MIRVCVRHDDSVVAQVKKMAQERNVKEADMWRLLVLRGLDMEQRITTNMIVESLCILRRFAADTDIEIVKTAKQDARNLLRQMGVVE